MSLSPPKNSSKQIYKNLNLLTADSMYDRVVCVGLISTLLQQFLKNKGECSEHESYDHINLQYKKQK